MCRKYFCNFAELRYDTLCKTFSIILVKELAILQIIFLTIKTDKPSKPAACLFGRLVVHLITSSVMGIRKIELRILLFQYTNGGILLYRYLTVFGPNSTKKSVKLIWRMR